MTKEDGLKSFERRARTKEEEKARNKGRGSDPLRDSPIDKGDVAPDLSPGGTRRDPEAIARAREQRKETEARTRRRPRTRAEYDEMLKTMNATMKTLQGKVKELEAKVDKQAERLTEFEKEKQKEVDRERGWEHERTRGIER